MLVIPTKQKMGIDLHMVMLKNLLLNKKVLMHETPEAAMIKVFHAQLKCKVIFYIRVPIEEQQHTDIYISYPKPINNIPP